jgi:hypothetical protein
VVWGGCVCMMGEVESKKSSEMKDIYGCRKTRTAHSQQ